jgi:hypothetical protein
MCRMQSVLLRSSTGSSYSTSNNFARDAKSLKAKPFAGLSSAYLGCPSCSPDF